MLKAFRKSLDGLLAWVHLSTSLLLLIAPVHTSFGFTDPLSVNSGTEETHFINRTEVNKALDARFATLEMDEDVNYILISDFNEDGHLDISLISHGGSYSQLFMGNGQREWRPGPKVKEVGFHPGEMINLAAVGSKQRYLLFAEGDKKIRILSVNTELGMDIEAEIEAFYPRVGNIFKWPGWGLSVVFAPFTRSMIVLGRDFNVETGQVSEANFLTFHPAIAKTQHIEVSDLGGDGIDEILFMNPVKSEINIIKYPCNGRELRIEPIWSMGKGSGSRFVFVRDIDQDGDMDLLVPDENAPFSTGVAGINILIQDDSGKYKSITVPVPGPAQNVGGIPGLRGTDFAVDNDGMGYVFTAGYHRLSLIRLPFGWEGDDHEMRQIQLSVPQGMPNVKLIDLDQDGWLDVVIAGGLGKQSGALVMYGPLWDLFRTLPAMESEAKAGSPR
jgi:hypothetical protein